VVANDYPDILASLREDALPVFERWLRERSRLNPFPPYPYPSTISGVCNVTADGRRAYNQGRQVTC
jgi:hypothetical protein